VALRNSGLGIIFRGVRFAVFDLGSGDCGFDIRFVISGFGFRDLGLRIGYWGAGFGVYRFARICRGDSLECLVEGVALACGLGFRERVWG